MRRGVTVLVGLLAVVTAAGFLERVSWVFEPATVFRLQYVSLLLAAALIALALRQRYLVVAAITLACVNIAAIAPWQHGPRAAASSADPTLRIVAFNIKSGNHRYDQLAPLIARLRPDVLGLVELTPAWARAAESASSRVRPRRFVVQHGAYGMGLLSATRRLRLVRGAFPRTGRQCSSPASGSMTSR